MKMTPSEAPVPSRSTAVNGDNSSAPGTAEHCVPTQSSTNNLPDQLKTGLLVSFCQITKSTTPEEEEEEYKSYSQEGGK